MTPFQVALFKHFIEGKGMVTIYINLYRKYHLKTNPISVEEFLFKVPETEVCTKAFYWVANMNYGYDYWTQMQLFWMEFLASNENNYTADEWYKLQGMSKILRTNWDAAKHWKQESRLTAAIRLGIDLKLIGAEDKEPTAPPTKLSEEYLRESTKDEILNRDFSAEKEASKQADAPAPADAMPDGGNENAQSAKSQCDKIAAWLECGFSITSLEALKRFGCMRLASRIHDLRERGMKINACKINTPTGKRVCEYVLAK